MESEHKYHEYSLNNWFDIPEEFRYFQAMHDFLVHLCMGKIGYACYAGFPVDMHHTVIYCSLVLFSLSAIFEVSN